MTICLFFLSNFGRKSDILQYYQDLCHYIIEDEAQDSSAIQQKLIELLSGKHKNLIRCGDINQAITTTFSNADVEGFSKIHRNKRNNCQHGPIATLHKRRLVTRK